MKSFQTITVIIENSIAVLTLDRPDKHNALNALMIKEIRQAVEILKRDDDVRGVVLSASGKSFCAGGDLNWMKEQASKDRLGKIAESSQLAMMLRDLDELPKPLIGRVHGPAYGGGIGMISVCDIAIASTDCRFALTETRLGLIPATIGPYVVRRLGEGHAREVFMTSKVFDANTALRLGLLSNVVSADALDDAIDIEVQALLQCEPGAVAAAKSLCQKLARNPGEDHLEFTANALADRWETKAATTGINAFFDRVKPPWIK